MTEREQLINALERISKEIQVLINPSYVHGLITHEELLSLSTAQYHLLGVRLGLEKRKGLEKKNEDSCCHYHV